MRKRRERILYLEDVPDIAEVTVMALEGLGDYEVRHCADGLEAVRLGPVFQPDLCLFDVMVPGIDGRAAYRELRRIMDPPPPAVFITAKAQRHEQSAYLLDGALGVIVKPFDPLTLCEELERLRALAPTAPDAR